MKKLYSELPKINTYSFTYLFIRPNSSTTYVDTAYCYRSSSVVCRSVSRSVIVSDIAVFVLKRDVKLQLTHSLSVFHSSEPC